MSTRVFCISARRPHAVPVMNAHGVDLTWVVPADEAPAYIAQGARHVVPVSAREGAFALPAARNAALNLAALKGDICVQVDDDLKRLQAREGDSWRPCSLSEAVKQLTELLGSSGAFLAGVPPTNNTYFARRGTLTQAFVIGSLSVIHPSSGLRYDTSLPLKEDYDFTCQHLAKHGRVARTGDIVAHFTHYINAGGAVAYRTDQLEHQVCATLLERWPQYLRPNPRRPHELLVKRPGSIHS